MSSGSQQNTQEDADGLEAAIDQAIAACGGDMRSTIRALIRTIPWADGWRTMSPI
ncbi:MAG: hypothetical protein QOG17_2996 [Gammaproteobacteria bacterium]|nr:hypothetical protein [Gammaproteobacteria bacterium]